MFLRWKRVLDVVHRASENKSKFCLESPDERNSGFVFWLLLEDQMNVNRWTIDGGFQTQTCSDMLEKREGKVGGDTHTHTHLSTHLPTHTLAQSSKFARGKANGMESPPVSFVRHIWRSWSRRLIWRKEEEGILYGGRFMPSSPCPRPRLPLLMPLLCWYLLSSLPQ